MPRRQPRSDQEQALSDFEREYEAVFSKLAAEQGAAPGVRRVSKPREVRDWGTEDRAVDVPTLAMRLQQGLTPEEAQALMVVQDNADNEELLAAFAQPVADPDLAEALAKVAKYPFRVGILSTIDDPEERVEKAEALDREWQKSLPAAPVESLEAVNPTPVGFDQMRPPTPPDTGAARVGGIGEGSDAVSGY